MKDLANGLFTVTVDELRESLSYNGEATFFYHGMESSYNNPWHPEKMQQEKDIVPFGSFWEFDKGKYLQVFFETPEQALAYVLPDGKSIREAISEFEFDDFV
ncbi:hypothetical protein [Weissella confusa]|uniref:hypothetical protein n=1 Tax=Weissella confusa TaxID=1583 RepID=UPI00223AE703|nr:hypothetical protein [Weissella confusa]MCT0014597.1 hypothetical protein [Weissella confusa]